MPPPSRAAVVAVAALLLPIGLPVLAAPSEGTAGQTVTGRSVQRPGTARSTGVASKPEAKPEWKDLTAAQQQALQPLAPYWDRLTEQRKLKWLAMSKNFPSLSPDEQAKLHRRMSKWVTLSQQQRAQARLNFNEMKALTPEQKAAEWEAYQALSAEEKRKLANKARTKPTAAATLKPAGKGKLPPVPSAKMAEALSPIQQRTLLPMQEPAHGGGAESSPYEDEPAPAQ